MYDMQCQDNSWLLGPCNKLFGRNIQTLAKQGQAVTKDMAMDMRHILIILPFLLEELFTDEVEEHDAGMLFIHHSGIM